MLKRKIFLDKKILRYKLWSKTIATNKLYMSILRNYMVKPVDRYSFIIKKNLLNSDFMFYKSQNKLQCYLSYSFKVPSKRINLSRFYLVRTVNKLYMGGYQK